MRCQNTILLTGGTGYIGSHTATELVSRGYNVILLDNLTNSTADIPDRISEITGETCHFINGDIRDQALVADILRRHDVSSVIHFAGLKSVSDSIDDPRAYYSTNVVGTISLLGAMQDVGVSNLVFSSSATVYGIPKSMPVAETHPTGPVNPYGRSKLHAEEILHDMAAASASWSIVCLRYFNPAGAHESGLLGERPTTKPNNLLPVIAEVATGHRSKLTVFGSDYDTVDGTGVRDFIHVMDLAEGHWAALQFASGTTGTETFNLGTGSGYSVLEMASAYEQASGKRIPLEFAPRRPGDVASCYADTSKAEKVLRWRAKRGLDDMCQTSWNFAQHSGA